MVATAFVSLLASATMQTSSAVVLSTRTTFPANTKADYQLGGPYTPVSNVRVVTRDSTASPVPGLFNICYINAFQTQSDAADFWQSAANDDLLLRTKSGAYFEDPDWEGEFFLDTSTGAKRTRIAAILNGWIDDCAKKGFQAIEPDNLDTFTRSNKLLTQSNNLALAKLIVDHAHSLGLLVAQKNTGSEIGSAGRNTAGFDFAVAEECQTFDECDAYTDVYENNVIEIEYTDADDAEANFSAACAARGSDISVILRDRNVVPSGKKGYHYEEC
ncbi:Glycoside hydrolase family 114 protein [Mycena kentingensis (nom. inval.)]|nr:Glycoside hydrolase family 114 protein [Mycena kentingensis (nom. inval.)]